MISKQLFGRLMITWGIFETETWLLSTLPEVIKFWVRCLQMNKKSSSTRLRHWKSSRRGTQECKSIPI
jgi:hypothetical protein